MRLMIEGFRDEESNFSSGPDDPIQPTFLWPTAGGGSSVCVGCSSGREDGVGRKWRLVQYSLIFQTQYTTQRLQIIGWVAYEAHQSE